MRVLRASSYAAGADSGSKTPFSRHTTQISPGNRQSQGGSFRRFTQFLPKFQIREDRDTDIGPDTGYRDCGYALIIVARCYVLGATDSIENTLFPVLVVTTAGHYFFPLRLCDT
jgi:hypothetical protein